MSKKRKKYDVHGTVIGGKFLGTFEAFSAEEAVEMALEEAGGNISLCHQCSGECEDGFVDTAEAEECRTSAAEESQVER